MGSRLTTALTASAAVLVAVVTVVFLAVGDGPALHVVVSIQVACALIFSIVSLRRARSEPRRGWVALGLFGIAWFINRSFSLVENPGPILADLNGPDDLVWLVGIPAGLFGLYVQSFGRIRGRTRRRVVSDGLVVALALMLTGWVIFHSVTFGGPKPEAGLGLVVPAFEILAACLVLTAAIYQPRRQQLWLCVAGLFAAIVGDASLAHQRATGRPAGDLVVLTAFTLTPVLLVGVALAPDSSDDTAGYAVTGPRRNLLYIPTGVALAAGLFEVWAHGGLFGLAGILGVALTVAVMVNHRLVSVEAFGLLEELKASRRLFKTTFDDAPVGLVVADADGVIIEANERLCEVAGVTADQVVGRTGDHMLKPEGRTDRSALRLATISGRLERYVNEAELARPDGETRWVRTTVSRLDRHPDVALVGVVEDITDRRAAQERLEYLAEHDQLTGLANRYRLGLRLEQVMEDATATRPAAVLVVDMDQFKLVNDSMGHAAGDHLLVECARRMVNTVGDAGLVARFGGDEFCVVLDAGPTERHTALCARLIDEVQGEVCLREGDAYPTVSVGAVLTRPGVSGEQLVAEADAALYRAKERGRNRVEWFGPAEVPRARSDLRLLGELNRALERGELRVYHQPVIEIASGRTVGTEALVRWQHPELGLLAPGAFLPMAETAGLMPAVGRFVLAEACATAAAWPTIPGHPAPLSVAVNLAVAQLLEPDFVDHVAGVLAETGLDPRRLWLEITESALMSDVRATGRTLMGLRNLGAHLSVDDFGTGYSSLTYLKRFPVEALKIDRSFVEGIGLDDDDTTIVSALVGLGRRLGLTVVAEGVETPLQLQVLSDLRCDVAQGYLFGRPVSAEAFAATFAELALPPSAEAPEPAGTTGRRAADRPAADQPAAAEPSKATGSPGLG